MLGSLLRSITVTLARKVTRRPRVAASILKYFASAGRKYGASPFRRLKVPDRKRPTILFVMEKWCDCDPARGETNSVHNLVGSLRNAGNADYRLFHFDKYWLKARKPSALGFMRAVARHKPDMAFVMINSGRHLHPSPLSMWLVSRIWRIPLVFCWFDFVSPAVRPLAMRFSRLAHASLVLDAPHMVTNDATYRKLFIPLWTPQDQTLFRERGLKREIDVCFLGSRRHYPDRQRILGRIRALGVQLFEGGGQREDYIGIDEYASILSRSKIVINFSREIGGSTRDQNKGRVYEGMLCGAMVLEQRNAETAHWFTEGVDLACFGDEEEALERIAWYLTHDRDREAIAANAHAKVTSSYNDGRFWATVISAVPPESTIH